MVQARRLRLWNGAITQFPDNQDARPVTKAHLKPIPHDDQSMSFRLAAVHFHPSQLTRTSCLSSCLEDARYLQPLVEPNTHRSTPVIYRPVKLSTTPRPQYPRREAHVRRSAHRKFGTIEQVLLTRTSGRQWIVLLAVAAFQLQAATRAETDHLLTQGESLAVRGDVDGALAAFADLKRRQPNDVRPYVAGIRVLLSAGRTRDAEAEASDALRIRELTPDQAVELALLLQEMGNPVAVSGVLERITPRRRLGAEGMLLLAASYREQRRLDEALAVLDELEASAGERSAEVYLERGITLLEKGELEKSMSAFETALELEPTSAKAYHGLSRVCLLGNNPEAALRMAEEAVRLFPTEPLYRFQLGLAHKALGNYAEAVRVLEEADRAGADAFSIAFELGDVLRRLGDREAAQRELERYRDLLDEKRKNQEIRQLEDEMESAPAEGRPQAALAAALKILEREPDHWAAHNRAAKLYLARGEAAAATIHIENLLRIDPNVSESHFLAALARQAAGDTTGALRYALEARRLRPGEAAVHNFLGNLYYRLGQTEEAIREYRAAAELAPEETGYRMNLAAAERRLQEPAPER